MPALLLRVQAAAVTITTGTDEDDGSLHRLTRCFDDNTTWNSFGGGVVASGAGQNARTLSNSSITGTGSNATVGAEGDQWYERDFDDSSGSSGEGSFGYGSINGGSINESLASGEITYLCRTSFDLTLLPDELTSEFLRGDGIVMYLNGNEVLRDNMPGGPIDAASLASSTISGSSEGVFNPFALDPADLVVGTNTLAVEVHNRGTSSSDLGFDMRLFGRGDLILLNPEPSTGTLLALGAIGIGVARRRR